MHSYPVEFSKSMVLYPGYTIKSPREIFFLNTNAKPIITISRVEPKHL